MCITEAHAISKSTSLVSMCARDCWRLLCALIALAAFWELAAAHIDCPGPPDPNLKLLPDNAVWDSDYCELSDGGDCLARCKDGFSVPNKQPEDGLPFVVVHRAYCKAGQWESGSERLTCTPGCTGGTGGGSGGSGGGGGSVTPAPARSCFGTPPAQTLPTSAAWNCSEYGTPDMSVCQATCNTGYNATALNAAFVSTCRDGRWDTAVGDLQCAAVGGCSLAGPEFVTLPANSQWSCTGSKPAATCALQCRPGTEAIGSRSVTCTDGVWSKPVGEQTCKAVACLGVPPMTLPANAVYNNSCTPFGLPNGRCHAVCAQGYTGEGTLYAPCLALNPPMWGGLIGSLTCTPKPAEARCSGAPPMDGMPANAVWNCTSTSAKKLRLKALLRSLQTCTGVCAAGYVNKDSGTRTVVCDGGKWGAPTGAVTCESATPNTPDPSPSPPNDPSDPPTPAVNCTAAKVPFCVDAASGVASSCRQSSTESYCLRLASNISCSYDYKPETTICDSKTKAVCSGRSAYCRVRYCGRLTKVPMGAKSNSACSHLKLGGSCTVQCAKGYTGGGYRLSCGDGWRLSGWMPVKSGCQVG